MPLAAPVTTATRLVNAFIFPPFGLDDEKTMTRLLDHIRYRKKCNYVSNGNPDQSVLIITNLVIQLGKIAVTL
jgi:hypothetical protein